MHMSALMAFVTQVVALKISTPDDLNDRME